MGQIQSAEAPTNTLSKTDLDRVKRRMLKLGRGRPELARSDLQSVETLKNNPFLARLIEMFDNDGDRLLSVDDMKNLLETLMQLKDEEAKYQFAFLVFDTDGDGFISTDELLSQLQKTNSRGLTTAQLQAIVDCTFVVWDGNKDGKLDYEEFKGLVSASTASELCL